MVDKNYSTYINPCKPLCCHDICFTEIGSIVWRSVQHAILIHDSLIASSAPASLTAVYALEPQTLDACVNLMQMILVSVEMDYDWWGHPLDMIPDSGTSHRDTLAYIDWVGGVLGTKCYSQS